MQAITAFSCVGVSADWLGEAWGTSAWGELDAEVPLAINQTGPGLPPWLGGQYMLASAAGFGLGKRNLTHAFDGYSKILRWRFHTASPPTLRARLLQSAWLQRSRAKEGVVPSSTVGAVTPPFTAAERAASPWTGNSDNFNVNIHDFGPRAPHVALSDISDPQACAAVVDTDTLTSSTFAWNDSWASPIADRIAPAHPRIIPDSTGDTAGLIVRLNPLAVSGIGEHSLILYRTNASSVHPFERRLLHEVKVKQLPYVHSIGITRTHAIVCAGPLHWDVAKLLVGEPASKGWTWDESASVSTIYVFPLDPNTRPTVYTATPFFAFHHINAWDTPGGGIRFDVLVNTNLTALNPNPAAAFALDVVSAIIVHHVGGRRYEVEHPNIVFTGTFGCRRSPL